MTLFLYAFTVYGIVHYYLFLKIQSIFPIESGAKALLWVFLFVMTLSPLFIHLYARRGPLRPLRIFAYISFLWMAFLFFFSLMAISIDVFNLAVSFVISVFGTDLRSFLFTPFTAFFIPLFLSIAFTSYGYFEAYGLKTERLTVKTRKLPEDIDQITIAHISDLHLGIIVREKKLDRIIRAIEQEKPDMIVSTGDLLDLEINHVDQLADILKTVEPRLGKFAVTGNHEFFAGIQRSEAFIQNAGFTLLRNIGTTVQNYINVAGIDDPLGKDRRFGDILASESEKGILSRLPENKFTLFLKHRPEIDQGSLGLYDLQLSGHTHKGQIFPGSLIVKFFFYPHVAGYTSLYKGSAMYVSRGAGTTLCPVRFLTPPEITMIEIVAEKKPEAEVKIET
jgi:predicted MPP superfamily phosphohydrolase